MEKHDMKFRHELKYLCSDAEKVIINNCINRIMNLDPHTNEMGSYLIRSIYFDDIYNQCFRENEDGTSPREKWRIRAYNLDKKTLRLECKRKEGGKIHKKSCPISEEEYYKLVSMQKIDSMDRPLLNQFSILQQTRLMKPQIIVEYMRIPYVYSLGNVRVTFDSNIASSNEIDRFFEKNISKRLILPRGELLLEVKYDEYLPDYIYHAIQLSSMQQITFSKYYLCRKFSI